MTTHKVKPGPGNSIWVNCLFCGAGFWKIRADMRRSKRHFCSDSCYRQWPTREELERRAKASINKTGTCWLWTGPSTELGYGYLQVKKKRVFAHRFVYEMLMGKIPEGLEIDHLCRNPRCVNPAHLEPVTHAENIRRSGPFKKQAFCNEGHPLSGDNLAPVGGGKYRCKTCKRINHALRIEALSKAGKCKCGRPLESSFKNCQLCRSKALDRYHKKG